MSIFQYWPSKTCSNSLHSSWILQEAALEPTSSPSCQKANESTSGEENTKRKVPEEKESKWESKL